MSALVYVTNSFRLATSVYTHREQLHKTLSISSALLTRVVCVPLHTRVFLKFKLNCTVATGVAK